MRKALWAVIAVVVVLGVAAGFVAWSMFGDRQLPAAPTTVDIAPGLDVHGIAGQLERSDVVKSSVCLELYLRARHLTSHILAAEYDFPAHESVSEVADVLAAGGHPATVRVTIPEGFTVAQVARRLEQRGLIDGAEFIQNARDTNLTIAGARTRGLEGYLFPDTYEVPRHTTASAVASLLTKRFFAELPPNYEMTARRMHYRVPQIVTVASMIEREAKIDAERPLIAGVIYNRLRLGMPLQIDATIEYALPRHKTALSFGDLALDSPYNTYRYRGLPPTPIANPGRKSLLAAFHPAKVDYLYYVYRGGGRHQFSRTLQEQQAAEHKYLR